jgi:hypothetical protein
VPNRRKSVVTVVAIAGIAAWLGMAGCGSVSDREASAAGVADRFLAAVADGDGAAACGVLTPDAVAGIEQDSGERCADAVLAEDLPDPRPSTDTAVYGQWARVRLGDEAVFLAMFPGGWRVAAAGCRPRGERPYDCAVDGG